MNSDAVLTGSALTLPGRAEAAQTAGNAPEPRAEDGTSCAPANSPDTLSISADSEATVSPLSRTLAAPTLPSGAFGATSVRSCGRLALGFPATAAEAVGPVVPGLSVFGLTGGGFGVVDVLAYVLAATGPAEVSGSTWTIGRSDLWRLAGLLTCGSVSRLRLLVDESFCQRQPAYHAALVERFGPETIAFTRTHAKFMVLRAAGVSLVLTTSSNLDSVVRLEWFSLTDDERQAAYLAGVVDRLFEVAHRGEPFSRFVEAERPAVSYFGAGPLDRDLRRSGWSFARSGEVLR